MKDAVEEFTLHNYWSIFDNSDSGSINYPKNGFRGNRLKNGTLLKGFKIKFYINKTPHKCTQLHILTLGPVLAPKMGILAQKWVLEGLD